MVEVILTDEALAWYESLSAAEKELAGRLLDLLSAAGVGLGFPYSSAIKGSKYALRELRGKNPPIRMLYAFDPERQAVVLIGGNKAGDDRFYEREVPHAEKIWETYLEERAKEKQKEQEQK